MTPRRFFAHALRVFKSPEHEFVLSAGLSVEWGGTGSSTVGAEAFNTYTPTLWFCHGSGRSRSRARSASDSGQKLHNDVRHRYLERRAVNDPAALFAHALSEVRAALNLTDYLRSNTGSCPEHRFVLSAGRFDIEALIRSTAQAAATAWSHSCTLYLGIDKQLSGGRFQPASPLPRNLISCRLGQRSGEAIMFHFMGSAHSIAPFRAWASCRAERQFRRCRRRQCARYRSCAARRRGPFHCALSITPCLGGLSRGRSAAILKALS